MASMVGGNFDTVQGWRVKSGIRQLIRTWEAIYNEAVMKNTNFRLILDLDTQSYYVRREVQLEPNQAQQVDYLKNLRTRKEKQRRAQQELEDLPTLEQEFEQDDAQSAQDLDKAYYAHVYSDPASGFRLGRPLSFPELGEPIRLPEGLTITGVKVHGKIEEKGQPFVRVSARNGAEFAVIYITAGEQEFTLLNDPGSGTFSVKSGHFD